MKEFLTLYGSPLLTSFFTAFLLLGCLLFLGKKLASRQGLKDGHHTPSPVLRFGGGALILAFFATLFWHQSLVFPFTWQAFLAVLLGALGIGWWDDIQNLKWPYQLGAQGGFLAVLYGSGVHILSLSHPGGGAFLIENSGFLSVGFLLFLFWGLFILNAVNWLDGLDGLLASVMIPTYLTLFFLALSPVVYQPPLAILLAAALGVTLAFLVYNYPPARIISGTAGTLFFGLTLIFVSVVAGTKIATTLLVLALPLTDALLVLAKRWYRKQSLFLPDQEHLHHLLKRRGWSNNAIALSYFLLTSLIGIIALHTEALGKAVSVAAVFGILCLVFFGVHFEKKIASRAVRPLIIFFGASLLLGIIFAYQLRFESTRNAWVSGEWFRLEVADTEAERAQGLSGRSELCPRCGMLFIFPGATTPSFWMKDMQFSLDILWLQNGRVVEKNENVPFPSLETFGPKVPVDAVIELPAGAAKDISVGAQVYFW